MQPKRKLTAIMFTDINGFMVSMAKDEFSAAIFTDLINLINSSVHELHE